jgi:hypothetical protein
MSTAEIIAEFPRLSAAALAQVQAKLRELVEPSQNFSRLPRVYSPHLADPEQARDFVKRVVELAPDAGL